MNSNVVYICIVLDFLEIAQTELVRSLKVLQTMVKKFTSLFPSDFKSMFV